MRKKAEMDAFSQKILAIGPKADRKQPAQHLFRPEE